MKGRKIVAGCLSVISGLVVGSTFFLRSSTNEGAVAGCVLIVFGTYIIVAYLLNVAIYMGAIPYRPTEEDASFRHFAFVLGVISYAAGVFLIISA
jgi:hypothetical protein